MKNYNEMMLRDKFCIKVKNEKLILMQYLYNVFDEQERSTNIMTVSINLEDLNEIKSYNVWETFDCIDIDASDIFMIRYD